MNLEEVGGVGDDSMNEELCCDVEDEEIPTMADPCVKVAVFASPIAPRGEWEREKVENVGLSRRNCFFTELVENDIVGDLIGEWLLAELARQTNVEELTEMYRRGSGLKFQLQVAMFKRTLVLSL